MKVHLVGGFSGSGKTTAISNARKILSDDNINTSVIIEDQVGYVVDNFNNQDSDSFVARVNGGCGCCNFYELLFQIRSLKEDSNPTSVFVEYSGTCSNLIDSILKPLKVCSGKEIEFANYSTLVDATLLLLYLRGSVMHLSVEDKYIWEQHFKEAEILIVNKIDLLTIEELEILKTLIQTFYNSKTIIFQNSIDKDSIKSWLEIISNPWIKQEEENDSIDCCEGVTGIAWLDEEIEFITNDNSATEIVYDFIARLAGDILIRKLTIEHLQFIISINGQSSKVDYSTLIGLNSLEHISFEGSNQVDLLVNARVRASPEELRHILYDVLNQFKVQESMVVKEKFISYFQP